MARILIQRRPPVFQSALSLSDSDALSPVERQAIASVLSGRETGTLVDAGSVSSSGGGEPTPSGNIFFDTRSGGAQDWQAAATYAAMLAYFDPDYPSPPQSRAVNAAGTGEVSMRTDWASQPGSEQSAQLNKYFVGSGIVSGSNTRGFGISYKRYLPSGFGYNDNGQGVKIWLALRSPDNSPDANRIYFVENNNGYNWQIDANSYHTGTFSRALSGSIGVVERHTHFINPAAGTIDFYINGTLIRSVSGPQNGATLGSGGIAQWQWNIAAFIQNACSQYYWDYVAWVPS